MGGADEQTITPPAVAAGDVNIHNDFELEGFDAVDIRIHESNGELHFHDDINNNKVAVRIDLFYKLWDDFAVKQTKKIIQFYDIKENTELCIEWVDVEDGVDTLITIKELKIGQSFRQLNKRIIG